MGRYIVDVAADAEVCKAGAAEKMISKMRAKLKEAEELPPQTRVCVRRPSDTASRWEREQFELLRAALDGGEADRIETKLGAVAAAGRTLRAMAGLSQYTDIEVTEGNAVSGQVTEQMALL